MSDWIRVDCPLCRGSDFRDVLTQRNRLFGSDIEATLCKCAGCGLHLTNPQPAGNELAALYESADYYTHGQRKGRLQALRRVFRRMQHRGPLYRLRLFAERRTNLNRFALRQDGSFFTGPPSTRFLDYGCGDGSTVKIASELGFDAVGIEPDGRARAAAHQEGMAVFPDLESLDRCATIGEEDGPRSFDRILLSHVLEHVVAPRELLIELGSRLRSGGRMLISVPNIGSLQAEVFGEYWIGLDMPRHLWHFSQETLGVLLQECGLCVVSSRTVELSWFADASRSLALEFGGCPITYSPNSSREIEEDGRGTEIVVSIAKESSTPGA